MYIYIYTPSPSVSVNILLYGLLLPGPPPWRGARLSRALRQWFSNTRCVAIINA